MAGRQESVLIGVDTQYRVAEAIYLRWHRNGHRHPRPWNEMDHGDREPWRRIAMDAIRTFHLSPEMRDMLDDAYDEGYDDASRPEEYTE
jgi:hypothetical protein